MGNRLYVFTGTFPFDNRESFLEQELPYLCSAFDDVFFLPLGGAGTKQRILPDGVKVDQSLHCGRWKKVILGIANSWRVFPLYYVDFFSSKVYLSKGKFFSWIKSTLLASYYLQSKLIKQLRKCVTNNDVLYYYWGIDYNCIAPFFKGKCIQVSRFHGDWDLWRDGGKREPYSPCREHILQSLTCAITISEKGQRFLKSLHPYLLVKTFRLGSLDCGVSKKSSDGIVRVLSCSTVYPLKRVDFIFECLQSMANKGFRIEWTHIGGGAQFTALRDKCFASNNEGIKVNLVGNLTHNDVLDYYKKHQVDVFINLSTNEGIPVSVMEAISFDVPVVATDVGATQEVVTEQSGVLVSPNPSIEEVNNAIITVLKKDLNPRAFWELFYNAEKNYQQFATYLNSLTI